MTLLELIKEDPRVVRGLKSLKQSELDLDGLTKELMGLHSSRSLRALSRKKILASSATILIDSTLQEAAFRSRAVEIQANVLYQSMKKDEIFTTLRKYILSRYKKSLEKKGFKSLTSQRDYVSAMIFDKYLTESRQMENLLKIAELVIGDIDASGWGLKRIEEVLTNLNKERYQ